MCLVLILSYFPCLKSISIDEAISLYFMYLVLYYCCAFITGLWSLASPLMVQLCKMLCQFIRRKMGNRLCILNVKIFYSLLNNQEDGHLLPYIPDAAFRKDSHWLACWFINSQPRLSPVGSRDGLCLTTGFHIYLSEQCD